MGATESGRVNRSRCHPAQKQPPDLRSSEDMAACRLYVPELSPRGLPGTHPGMVRDGCPAHGVFTLENALYQGTWHQYDYKEESPLLKDECMRSWWRAPWDAGLV